MTIYAHLVKRRCNPFYSRSTRIPRCTVIFYPLSHCFPSNKKNNEKNDRVKNIKNLKKQFYLFKQTKSDDHKRYQMSRKHSPINISHFETKKKQYLDHQNVSSGNCKRLKDGGKILAIFIFTFFQNLDFYSCWKIMNKRQAVHGIILVLVVFLCTNIARSFNSLNTDYSELCDFVYNNIKGNL